MAIRYRRSLWLVVSCALALLTVIYAPTGDKARASTFTGSACGSYDPASRVLTVHISAQGFGAPGSMPLHSVAQTDAGEWSTGGANQALTWSSTGDVTFVNFIPNPTVNHGTFTLMGVNADYIRLTGTFGACPGSPPITTVTLPPVDICPAALFVGIRGSGQTVKDSGGFGAEVAEVEGAFGAAMPADKRVNDLALDYTAADTSLISQGIGRSNSGYEAYLSSINDGLTKLARVLHAEQTTCPATKVVVAGYSQGALVANLTVRQFSNVAAVVLIADPARVPNQTGHNYGTASPGFGIYHYLFNTTPITTPSKAFVEQICDAHDAVCDTSHDRKISEFVSGVTIHTSYVDRDRSTLNAMAILAVRGAGFTPRAQL